jgi:hypothetical protein
VSVNERRQGSQIIWQHASRNRARDTPDHQGIDVDRQICSRGSASMASLWFDNPFRKLHLAKEIFDQNPCLSELLPRR